MKIDGLSMDELEQDRFWKAITGIQKDMKGITEEVTKTRIHTAELAQHVKTQNGRITDTEGDVKGIKYNLSDDGPIGKKLAFINTKVLLAMGGLASIGILTLIGGLIITVLTLIQYFNG